MTGRMSRTHAVGQLVPESCPLTPDLQVCKRDHRRSRPAQGLQSWSPALHTQDPRSPWRHTPGLFQATSALCCFLPPGSQFPERRKCENSLLRESTWFLSKKLARAGSRPAGFQQEQVHPRPVGPAPEGKQKRKRGPDP